eukprot:15013.XXX_467566_467676_1 [CDS] Oithona nana genome sequencing.
MSSTISCYEAFVTIAFLVKLNIFSICTAFRTQSAQV